MSIRPRSELKKPFQNKALLQSLHLEITERCNNACVHCGINRNMNDSGVMEKEIHARDIKRILKEARELGCTDLKITGGEPLVRQDFEEIYLYARKLGLRVSLFTNATLINHEIAGLFRDVPPLEKIEVTLYGMCQASAESVTRNSGAFRAAFHGLGLLQKYEIPFLLKFAYLSQNSDDVDDFRNYCKKSGHAADMSCYVLLYTKRIRRDSSNKNRKIDKLRISPENADAFFLKYLQEYLDDLPNFLAATAGPQGKTLFGCGAGRMQGTVDAYGGFSPCLLLKNPRFTYDLRKGSLEEALTKCFPIWRSAQAEDPLYLERCARCFLKSLCEQCPAISWIESGKLDRPVRYYCQIAHALAARLGLLAAGERAWLVTNWRERIRNQMGERATNE